jgi:hypothetical protein
VISAPAFLAETDPVAIIARPAVLASAMADDDDDISAAVPCTGFDDGEPIGGHGQGRVAI